MARRNVGLTPPPEIEAMQPRVSSRQTLPFPFPASDSWEIADATAFVCTTIFFIRGSAIGGHQKNTEKIRFEDSQNEYELVLPQTVASGGQSSSMASGDDAERKPKRRRRALSSGNGKADDDTFTLSTVKNLWKNTQT
uniref:Uncharacterized protein n=1 Tax=Oryza brachyantha TaxID=4533 RepID=J3N1I8_ORYBR